MHSHPRVHMYQMAYLHFRKQTQVNVMFVWAQALRVSGSVWVRIILPKSNPNQNTDIEKSARIKNLQKTIKHWYTRLYFFLKFCFCYVKGLEVTGFVWIVTNLQHSLVTIFKRFRQFCQYSMHYATHQGSEKLFFSTSQTQEEIISNHSQ